jgi:hypothetical protein
MAGTDGTTGPAGPADSADPDAAPADSADADPPAAGASTGSGEAAAAPASPAQSPAASSPGAAADAPGEAESAAAPAAPAESAITSWRGRLSALVPPAWRIPAALLIFVLLALVAFRRALARRGRQAAPVGRGADLVVAAPGPAARAVLEGDTLSGMFPSKWLASADRGALERWIAESRAAAAAAYFGALGARPRGRGAAPGRSDLDAAESALAAAINQALAGGGLFAALGGDPAARPDPAVLRLHLDQLLPPLRLPPPPLQAEPGAAAMAASAALGALAGGWGLALVLAKAGQTPVTGLWLGSVAGAALAVLLAMRLGLSPKVRRTLLLVVGGAALADAAAQVVKGPLAAVPGLGAGGFLKRLALYAGAAAALLIIKARPVLDRGLWAETVETSVTAWLESAVPLAAALSQKASARPGALSDEAASAALLAEAVPLVKKLIAQSQGDSPPALAALARRLSNAGWDLGPAEEAAAGDREPKRLAWEPAMAATYDTFGLIGAGQAVVEEEAPVVKDGLVVRKGLVAPL